MSWRSQGQKNLVHNMSLNLLFFQLFVNFVLAISRPFYFGVTLCQNLTYFFQMSWRLQGQKNLVHNISQKFVVFSTICKLCPCDFQAILFWFHIVPESKLFNLSSDVLAIDRKDIQSKCTISHKNLLFFQLFVNFVLAISRPFYFGLTLCQIFTYFFSDVLAIARTKNT